MTPAEVLSGLLDRAESRDSGAALIRHADRVDWPKGVFEACLSSGVLVAGEPALAVQCDACDDEHWERVFVVRSWERSESRMFISCPTFGRQIVDSERLRQWRVSVDGIATLLARHLQTGMAPVEVVPGRLWEMGLVSVGAGRVFAAVVRGLTWVDGASVLRRCRQTGRVGRVVLSVCGEAIGLPAGWIQVPLSLALVTGAHDVVLDRATLQTYLPAGAPYEPTPSKRGRPKGSSSFDAETKQRMMRDARKYRVQGIKWVGVAALVGVSVDTLQRWLKEAELGQGAVPQKTAEIAAAEFT